MISRDFGRLGADRALLAVVIVALVASSSALFGSSGSAIWVSPSGQSSVLTSVSSALTLCKESSPCAPTNLWSQTLDAACEFRLLPGNYAQSGFPQCGGIVTISFVAGGVYQFDSSFQASASAPFSTDYFGAVSGRPFVTLNHNLTSSVALATTFEEQLVTTFSGAKLRYSVDNTTHAYIQGITSPASTAPGSKLSFTLKTVANNLFVSNLVFLNIGIQISALGTTTSHFDSCHFINAQLDLGSSAIAYITNGVVMIPSYPFMASGARYYVETSDFLMRAPCNSLSGLAYFDAYNVTVQGFGSSKILFSTGSHYTSLVISAASNVSMIGMLSISADNSDLTNVDLDGILMTKRCSFKSSNLTGINGASKDIASAFQNTRINTLAFYNATNSTHFNGTFTGGGGIQMSTCQDCIWNTSAYSISATTLTNNHITLESLKFTSPVTIIKSNIVMPGAFTSSSGLRFINSSLSVGSAATTGAINFSGGALALTEGNATFDEKSTFSLPTVRLCANCTLSVTYLELTSSVVGGTLRALNPGLADTNSSSWNLHSINVTNCTVDVSELTAMNYTHDGNGITITGNGSVTLGNETFVFVEWALKSDTGAIVVPAVNKQYVLLSRTNSSSILGVGREYDFFFWRTSDSRAVFSTSPPAPMTPDAGPSETSPTPTSSAVTIGALSPLALALAVSLFL